MDKTIVNEQDSLGEVVLTCDTSHEECLLRDTTFSRLILDSGATKHMFSKSNPNVHFDDNLTTVARVKFADGTETSSLGLGTLVVNGYILRGMIMPFKVSLISAKELAVE